MKNALALLRSPAIDFTVTHPDGRVDLYVMRVWHLAVFSLALGAVLGLAILGLFA